MCGFSCVDDDDDDDECDIGVSGVGFILWVAGVG